jgi:hypothetical protein
MAGAKWPFNGDDCSKDSYEKIESSIRNELLKEDYQVSGLRFFHKSNDYQKANKQWVLEFETNERGQSTAFIYCTGHVKLSAPSLQSH